MIRKLTEVKQSVLKTGILYREGVFCPLLVAGRSRGSRRHWVLSDIWCQIRAICFKHHNEFQVDRSPEDSSKREVVSRSDGIMCIENVRVESDRENIWTKGSRNNSKWRT